MKKVILHCDLNNFYASVECMKNPSLKDKCVAVSGNPENRHGIILAKNENAKRYQIKTGDVIWQALQKCPQLVLVPPNFHEYLYLSKLVKDIYKEYSDRVESYGIDEAWIDVSESVALFGDGETIAQLIKEKVNHLYGLTLSIGVADNKIYAKLGSDYKKPDAITVFDEPNYETLVYPQPVENLLFVGRSTTKKLHSLNIYTIHDLILAPEPLLVRLLGKMGKVIQQFAKGNDQSEVLLFDQNTKLKSIGNGITCKRDMHNLDDAKIVIYVLADSIATRLRRNKKVCKCIRVHFRNQELYSFSRQVSIDEATNLCEEIAQVAISLTHEHYNFDIAMRSISITAANLYQENQYHQLSLFSKRDKLMSLEVCIDQIRRKYGVSSISRVLLLKDRDLSDFSPLEDHLIFPQNYFK